LKREGYKGHSEEVEVKKGTATQVAVELPALPPEVKPVEPPPAPPLRPRWRLYTGGVGLGIGALLAGFGGVLYGLDGTSSMVPVSCGDSSMPEPCELKTHSAGAGLLAVGLAVTVGATVLLVIPGKQPKMRGVKK
jgi:hypothetical protein